MKNRNRIIALLSTLVLPTLLLFGLSSHTASLNNKISDVAWQDTNSNKTNPQTTNSLEDDWFYNYNLYENIRYGTVLGVGNFNDDNLTDLAVAGCYFSCTLNILLQNGDGVLVDSGTTYTYTNGGSDYLLVSDLNNDNRDDIALIQQFSNPDSIKVFLQQSNSMFDPVIYATNYRPDAITAGDFNHDGLADLSASFFGASVIGVFLQDSSGNLKPAVYYATRNTGFHDMTVGDFNNDGLADIAQTHGAYGYVGPSITLFYQNMAGTFDPANHFDIDPNQHFFADSVAAGDINNDGLDDLLIQSSKGLSVFEQGAGGMPATPTNYPGYCNPSDIEISDINLDGLNDVLSLGDGCIELALYLQQESDNSLAPYETYPIAYGGSFDDAALDAGDINNDDRPDAMIAVRDNGLAVLYHSVPDFALKIKPTSVEVNHGTDSITFTMIISRLYNFTDTVSLSVTQSPVETNHNLPTGPFGTPHLLDFSIKSTATLTPTFEPYLFEVLGTSSGISHTTKTNIVILHRTFLPLVTKGYFH